MTKTQPSIKYALGHLWSKQLLSPGHITACQCFSPSFLCPPSHRTSHRGGLYGSQTKWNLAQLFSKVTLEMQKAKKGCCESCPRNLHARPCVCSKNYDEDLMGNIQHKKKFLGWYMRRKNIFDFSNFSHFCGFWGCRRIQTSLKTSSYYLDKLWLPMTVKEGFDFLVKWG